MLEQNGLSRALEEARKKAVQDYYDRRHETVARLAWNVVGVGIGHKGTGSEEKRGVHIYVDGLKQNHPDRRIPIEDFAKSTGVDAHLIEAGRFHSFGPEAGCSIGLDYEAPNVDPSITGTLGAVVDIAGTRYALGSNHVMRANGHIPADKKLIFRPANRYINNPTPYIFARTDEFVELNVGSYLLPGVRNVVDCALAKIDYPRSNKIANEEVKFDTPVAPQRGMTVKRVDVSDNAIGTVVDIHAHLLMDYSFGTVDLEDQVVIESQDPMKPFARRGDSGGLLVDQNSQATALVVGGSMKDFRSKNPVAYTIACPLSKVFEALERRLGISSGTIKLVVPAAKPDVTAV